MICNLITGECLDAMRAMPDNSVDSIVTDPPYGLSFMGKKWDYDVPSVEIWAECLRVLKPGGHLLAFAGTRTQHRMACRIEDAGFEIRDMIAWVYSSGFPKSLNVSKAIDKAAGAKREVVGFDPATEAAREWQGWGTALKPALEPITMARKPFASTVADNVLAHGTGALNIDGCRVGGGEPIPGGGGLKSTKRHEGWVRPSHEFADAVKPHALGRWPANLIHDGSDEVLAGFPASKSSGNYSAVDHGYTGGNQVTNFSGKGVPSTMYSDTGSAARFFYQVQPDIVSMREGVYNEACLDQNHPPKNVSIADSNSSPPNHLDATALAHAVSLALPEGVHCESRLPGLSTSATQSELRLISESATQAILTFASEFWLERQHAKLSLSLSHANVAVIRNQTGTTLITINLLKSDGFAGPVTFSITPKSLEAGEKDCEPSTGRRFIYSPKASKKDRDEGLSVATEMQRQGNRPSSPDETGKFPDHDHRKRTGNHHPTVKPTNLMAYLARLVTPPGGTVLDPFMGSGSTGKAAALEGFGFIGIEREAEYVAIAQARINAARLPLDLQK